MTGASYRDIAADLRAQIESGQLAPGARLPTEAQLAVAYKVQRNIARLALAELVADGLVSRKRRLGTFVRDRDPVRVPFSVYQRASDTDRDITLGPWETACAQLGIAGRTDVVSVDLIVATAKLAGYLGINEGATLVRRHRRLLADEAVSQLQWAFMPLELVDGTPLAEAEKVIGGAHAAFAALGMTPTTATFWAVARTATGAEREDLDLVLGVPVLETWRITSDATGRRIELLQTVSDAEKTMLVFDELPLGSSHA